MTDTQQPAPAAPATGDAGLFRHNTRADAVVIGSIMGGVAVVLLIVVIAYRTAADAIQVLAVLLPVITALAGAALGSTQAAKVGEARTALVQRDLTTAAERALGRRQALREGADLFGDVERALGDAREGITTDGTNGAGVDHTELRLRIAATRARMESAAT